MNEGSQGKDVRQSIKTGFEGQDLQKYKEEGNSRVKDNIFFHA